MRFIRRIIGATVGTVTEGRRKPRSGSQPAPLRARLTLDTLDSRLAPSSLIEIGIADPTQIETGPPTGPILVGPVVPEVTADPVIVNFDVEQVIGNLFRFSGTVTAATPGGLTINFGGEPESLQGKTATTDANGYFEISLFLKLDGSDTGTATAQAVSSTGGVSNLAMVEVIAR